ncbi:MAG: hypothetical protein SPL71_15925 [Oribacterium sp.]|nr:hypothetical protein [Oribacterium sp.]
MYDLLLNYYAHLSADLLNGCKTTAYDGTILYTPDGVENYNGLWLRDFSYMVEYSGLVPKIDIIRCINYSIAHRRKDGWMPDRVYGDGTAVYAAGATGYPIGEANLDTTPFLIFTVYSLFQLMADDSPAEFKALYSKWMPYLENGMDIIPLSDSGLVYNDPFHPHSPYGFTDTVCKTGELFYESLLYWRACRMMLEINKACRIISSFNYEKHLLDIQRAIVKLFDNTTGCFFAATEDCCQPDIWGMMYMLYIGFPCGKEIADKTTGYLFNNRDRYLYQGQVRHLPKGEYWQRLLIDVPHETYQNGAFWATASGWALWVLASKDFSIAAQELVKLVNYMVTYGSFECVNEGYQKLGSMVVSATNVYGGLRRLGETENFRGFIDQNYAAQFPVIPAF